MDIVNKIYLDDDNSKKIFFSKNNQIIINRIEVSDELTASIAP
jgi:hypothetical protein